MSDMPEELMKEILSRLPVKPLLRSRCVSKSWRSLIDSKNFMQLHLHHSSESNSNRTLLVDSTSAPPFHIDLDSFQRLDIGRTPFDPHTVTPSCNGLFLIVPKSGENLVLWNPSIRKFREIPMPPPLSERIRRSNYAHELFALGYDSVHDEYKAVAAVQASTRFDNWLPSYSETLIYSLEAKSWKRIKGFPYMLPTYRWGVYLNGALHTVLRHGHVSLAIVAFDVGKEEYYEMPMPEVSGAGDGYASVEVMGGCLTAVIPGKMNSSEIWLMKEYGFKESWIKLLCFDPLLPEPCTFLCPLAYSKSGDEVLLDYNRMCLVWYNLRRKSITIACVNGLSASFGTTASQTLFDAEVCVGSLVSPHGPSGMEVEEQKGRRGEKGKKIKKKRDDFLSAGFRLEL